MASQLLGRLNVLLGLDATKFNKALAKSEKDMAKLGRSMEKIGANLSLSVTAPIAALGGSIVKTAGDFEAAMNRVGAITNATGSEFSQLSAKAKELGISTQFSASQAAEGIEILAKNGLNATQILDGAVDASLNLAAATGADLAGAADIATDVMASFGKEAKELGVLINGITGVTLKSKFSIEDYRLALGQAGGAAGTLGVSLEDFNTAIAATSNVFASGSDAGTSFKTFLQRLVPASKEAKEEMNKLGLEFFEANGDMKSLANISEQLKRAFSTLSDEQRNAAASTIFGSDALRTALALADVGAAKFNALSTAIQGTSALDQANARMKGFNGAMKRLQSAFEGLQIAIAESGLLNLVTNFVTSITKYVTQLASADKSTLRWATALAGLAAAIAPLTLILGKFVGGTLPALTNAFKAFAFLLSPIVLKIGLIIAAIAGLVLIGKTIYDTWSEVGEFFSQLWKGIVDTFTKAIAFIGDKLNQFAEFVGLKETFESVKEFAGNAGEEAVKLFDSALGEGKFEEFTNNLKANLDSVVSLVQGAGAKAGNLFTSAFSGGGGGVSASSGGGSTESSPLGAEPSEGDASGAIAKAIFGDGGKEQFFEDIALTQEALALVKEDIAPSDEDITAWDEMWQGINKVTEGFKVQKKQIEANKKAMVSSFAAGASAAGDLGNAVLSAMRDSVKGLVLQGIAGVVSNALATLPPLIAVPTAAGLGAAASVLFDKFIPKFAEGGLVTSATLGIFGEAGAEAVIPLDRLERMLGVGQQAPINGQLIARVAGSDLEFVLEQHRAEENFTF